jgi:hypothetical protein
MQSLDLNIHNYSKNDLENFFKLAKNYTQSEVELMENKIREQLINSGHVAKSMKRDLITFLKNAKEKLIDFKENVKIRMDNASVLPINTTLDSTEYISNPEKSRKNELNLRERTQFIHTQPSEFLPGKINPIHTRVISKCLTIDTRFRSNYFTSTSSDFNFQMPVILNRVVSMQLSSFEIPVSFYGISEFNKNNYLRIIINYNEDIYKLPVDYASTFKIPDGNYNANTLLDTINNSISNIVIPTEDDTDLKKKQIKELKLMKTLKLILGIDQNTGSGNGKVYIAIDKTNADLISALNHVRFDFTLDFYGNLDTNEYSKKIGWNLGFNKPKYTFYNSSETISPPIYSSENENISIYKMLGISETIIEPATVRYIYLAIDDFNSSVNDLFTNAFYKSIMSPDVIARISIKSSYFSLLMENDLSVVTEPRSYFGPVDIQRIRVRLYDDRGNILQMNDSNFSFCLVFKMLYDL